MAVVDWQAYLEATPGILGGKMCLRGRRLSAEFMVDVFKEGWPIADICREYGITEDQFRACYVYMTLPKRTRRKAEQVA